MAEFNFPTNALDDRLAIVGTSGSGKTYAAGILVERVLANKDRAVIIDPLGVWWGLRLMADGKTPSRFAPVIFGGDHADVPINDLAGALVGETVGSVQESAIVDLSALGTKAAERRFMLAFLTALYRKTNGSLLHLVIDEADMFAPQKLLDKAADAAKLLGMMETIVRRGRVKGFIPWLISQRPAVLSKDVLSQADGLIAMKLTASHDRKAIGSWIEGQADPVTGKEILASLPAKQLGSGVVWIPGRGILEHAAFPAKVTFDSSKAPKRGERKVSAQLKPLDIDDIKSRLSTVKAEAEANDPAKLRAEIANLRKNASLAPAAPDTQALIKARADGFNDGRAQGQQEGQAIGIVAGVREATEIVEEYIRDVKGHVDMVITGTVDLHKRIQNVAANAQASPTYLHGQGFALNRSKLPAALPNEGLKADGRGIAPNKAAPPRTDDNIQPRHLRILRSLSFWKAIGETAPTRSQVAFVAGYSPKSSGFEKIISTLSSEGLINYPGPGLVGLATATSVDLPITEARDIARSVLDPRHLKLVEALAHVEKLTRSELAEATDYSDKSSGFEKTISTLRSLDIVTYPNQGSVALTEWAKQVIA